MNNIIWGLLLFAWGYIGYVLAVAVAWVVVIIVLFGMDQWQWLLTLIPITGIIVVHLLFHDRVDQWLRRRADRPGSRS